MRILAIADEPSKRLWGDLCREALSGVDLILSAGDLPAKYLSFLTCFTDAPIVYVRGNHDDRYEKEPPEGCLCADGKIIQVSGVRILGLGGSIRYRPDGVNMFSEKEMASIGQERAQTPRSSQYARLVSGLALRKTVGSPSRPTGR